MIEVEVKLQISNRTELEAGLLRLGFSRGKSVKEEDIYVNSEQHDFRKSDEALRIRKVTNLDTGDSHTVLTYKGPKVDKISMTRQELETGIEDLETMRSLLKALGYNQEYPVIKKRYYYTREQITACIDEVEGLGDFMELEILLNEDQERTQALEQISEILNLLGYGLSDTTRTSYLSMLMSEWEE